MIAALIKAPKGGRNGRALGEYIVGIKRDERVGDYILDNEHKGEKVEYSRTENLGTDNPMHGVELMVLHNKQNQRAAESNKTMHLVVSFPPGERPSREQMVQIEDRLVAALGMERHPRLSAVHSDRSHYHLHVMLSRIDPETHKAIHPRGDYYSLQKATRDLEREMGLTQGNKTINFEQTHVRRRERPGQGGERLDRRAWEKAHQRHSKQHLPLKEKQWLDHVPSGWRKLTPQDIARELSPAYASAAAAAEKAASKAEHAKRSFEHWQQEHDVAEYRIGERSRSMGVVAKVLNVAVRPDPELTRWKGERDKAQVLADRSATEWTTARDAGAAHQRRAAAALEAIRPAAEAELAKRQHDANQARAALHRLDHQQRQSQTRRLRYDLRLKP